MGSATDRNESPLHGSSDNASRRPRHPWPKRLKSPRTLISFALAGAFIFFIFRNLDLDVGEIAGNIANGNPFWIALAFAAYYGAFPLRAWRWRMLMANAGIYDGRGGAPYRISSLSEIILLSWFANCLVPAKLGDAYRGYLMRERAGVSFASTLGTIVAERFIDVLALVSLMVCAALITFHGDVPPGCSGCRSSVVAHSSLPAFSSSPLSPVIHPSFDDSFPSDSSHPLTACSWE